MSSAIDGAKTSISESTIPTETPRMIRHPNVRTTRNRALPLCICS